MPGKTNKSAPHGSRKPIGVFDSGVGGLSVLRALVDRLPGEDYIYFGDTARAPYGERSPDEIQRFNLEIGGWLLARDCKMLIIACNTSTVWGMEALKKTTEVPIYGLMEAIMEGTLSPDKDRDKEPVHRDIWPVGFIATQGTVTSGNYQAAFSTKAPEKPFFAQPCPLFVPLVERGILGGSEMDRAVEESLTTLRDSGIHTLILGCTHYPFMASAISAFMGSGVRLVDPAYQLASIVENALQQGAMLNDRKGNDRGYRSYWCSGDTKAFEAVSSHLLGYPLENVNRQVF